MPQNWPGHLGLFCSGLPYQLDKNALTYGLRRVIATLSALWPARDCAPRCRAKASRTRFGHRHFLTLDGLEELIHADTMLFILGSRISSP